MPTETITDDQAAALREQLALYERQKAYQAALARNALCLVLKPIVESEEFIDLHQKISDIRDNGPKDDMFFGIPLDAIFNGMTGLGIQVANWTAPVDPNAPVAPLVVEGSTNE
ncbi:hypothetical protein [Sphingomonas sp. BAUL-RG-20F-R05-02]|uniref:hypothetical protein n=1 Tax=Sphingomonas sp. BAUL-RG-20F-R05-02 TaxID=2914830 RepID=UPI001F5A9524|nr:hypothetical protein [Sphingomonas sp. BAUL-RG-20F-R05-02]